jgi:hypothetical protein
MPKQIFFSAVVLRVSPIPAMLIICEHFVEDFRKSLLHRNQNSFIAFVVADFSSLLV